MTMSKDSCNPLTARASGVTAVTSAKSDLLTFFRAWTENPLQVASIMPSGDALSELISSEISSTTGPVIELGPGTGVFTRALLDRGVQERDLTLIEFSSVFAVMLQARFRLAAVSERKIHQELSSVDAVVTSVYFSWLRMNGPMLVFDEVVRRRRSAPRSPAPTYSANANGGQGRF